MHGKEVKAATILSLSHTHTNTHTHTHTHTHTNYIGRKRALEPNGLSDTSWVEGQGVLVQDDAHGRKEMELGAVLALRLLAIF